MTGKGASRRNRRLAAGIYSRTRNKALELLRFRHCASPAARTGRRGACTPHGIVDRIFRGRPTESQPAGEAEGYEGSAPVCAASPVRSI